MQSGRTALSIYPCLSTGALGNWNVYRLVQWTADSFGEPVPGKENTTEMFVLNQECFFPEISLLAKTQYWSQDLQRPRKHTASQGSDYLGGNHRLGDQTKPSWLPFLWQQGPSRAIRRPHGPRTTVSGTCAKPFLIEQTLPDSGCSRRGTSVTPDWCP